jgi:serine/threonine-protein kinase
VIGQVIGNYKIVRQLGEGGMGAVYLAEHQRIARRAAIKLLLPQFSNDAMVLERFFSEARATSVIRHPGIVEILDCGVHQDRAYIVMELLEGQSVAGLLREAGPLRGPHLPMALEIGRQIADAVGAAHTAGIVHRDLKPDNAFLVGQPLEGSPVLVKILDFGIAKLSGGEMGKVSTTRSGTILGTPTYMSPEQCRGSAKVDSRADIYSLGCILFEALAGRPPFVYEGVGDLIIAHVSEAPPPLRSMAPEAPAALEALIARMLAKAPAERPATMQAAAAELQGLVTQARRSTPGLAPPEAAASPGLRATVPATSSSPSLAAPRPSVQVPTTTLAGSAGAMADPPAAPPRRRLVGATVTAGTAAIVVAGALFYAFGRSGPAPAPPAPARPAEAAAAPAPPPTPVVAAPTPPPEPATVEISVEDAPEGLTVEVDGARQELPVRLPRAATLHQFRFSAPGHRPLERKISARRDQTLVLEMAAEARAPRHPAAAEKPRAAPRAEPAPAAEGGGDLDSLAEPTLTRKRKTTK